MKKEKIISVRISNMEYAIIKRYIGERKAGSLIRQLFYLMGQIKDKEIFAPIVQLTEQIDALTERREKLVINITEQILEELLRQKRRDSIVCQ